MAKKQEKKKSQSLEKKNLNDKAFVRTKQTGRPTKLTPELQETICQYIAAGNYIETACKANGVSKQILYDWLSRGAKKEEPFKSFLDAVEKAMGISEARDVSFIDKAAKKGQWQAAAWRLERKNTKKWGRKETIRHEAERDPDQNSMESEEDKLNKYIAERARQIEDDRWNDED